MSILVEPNPDAYTRLATCYAVLALPGAAKDGSMDHGRTCSWIPTCPVLLNRRV